MEGSVSPGGGREEVPGPSMSWNLELEDNRLIHLLVLYIEAPGPYLLCRPAPDILHLYLLLLFLLHPPSVDLPVYLLSSVPGLLEPHILYCSTSSIKMHSYLSLKSVSDIVANGIKM